MTAPADASRPPFYVTTAIAYPNGAPHIGHAYEYIATDTIARFKRLDGYDVRFLTGTDEHGLKMQQTAQNEGIDVRQLAARNSDAFQAAHDLLQSSYGRFIRTTDADHHAASQELWRLLERHGDIYLDAFSGWYSVRDEAFYTEAETTLGEDGSRVATETNTPVEWTEEPSYFFRLSQYQDKLLELYDASPDFIAPNTRRNEIVNFVKGGLRDLSISRTTFDWGVPVPGDPAHVMYVWVDALTNYLTGAGFPETDSEAYQKFWPADLHVIGKDITRFHTVYWPAFLMSAGIELPKRVFVHGFLNVKGEKMSKSLGNVLTPDSLVENYGLDPVRFFFLREVSFGQDGSYSHEAIVARVNADLSNELGNLAQRSLTMVAKNLEGKLPTPGDFTAEDEEMLARADALLEICRREFEVQAIHSALEAVWSVLGETNRYFSLQQPWVLRKTDPDRMATVLYVTIEVLRIVSILAQPVMPDSASRILDLLGTTDREFSAIATRSVAGTALPTPTPVFPKYE